MITNDTKRRIKDTANIVDVVSHYVDIKSSGKNYFGRCPFHDEKTKSFTVSEPKNFYHCFGCGAHGDSIDFVMNYESVSFPEALRRLARMYNIPIDEEKRPTGKPYMPKSVRDQMELDRTVIHICASDMESGRPISKQDEARYWEAIKRIEQIRNKYKE